MVRFSRVLLAGIAAAGILSTGLAAQDAPAPSDAATAFTPAETVAARQGLKAQVAIMRTGIEFAVEEGDSESFESLAADFATIAAIVEAFPHLFPADTNPDAIAEAGLDVSTDASSAIWDDFAAFAAMAKSVAATARAASEAPDFATLAQASTGVWAACTACHDAYLVYDPFAAMEGMELDIDSPFF